MGALTCAPVDVIAAREPKAEMTGGRNAGGGSDESDDKRHGRQGWACRHLQPRHDCPNARHHLGLASVKPAFGGPHAMQDRRMVRVADLAADEDEAAPGHLNATPTWPGPKPRRCCESTPVHD